MLVLATICSNGLSIDRKSRKICFNGIDCIRYRTEGQFNAAYEAVMKILEYCKGDEKSRR
jgi:hypothetical protein